MNIVGREKEIESLKRLCASDEPEFLVVKGRRRVGKTYLINHVFEGRFAFKHTGRSPVDLGDEPSSKLKEQLAAFHMSLVEYGYRGKQTPKTWLEAFCILERLLEKKNDGSKQIVFIDELPWLDTPRSGFVSSFEFFWNNWANTKNILLIVCGSASSWVDDNLLNNYGGLYNRVTKRMELLPFSLNETKTFLREKGFILSDYDVAQIYMILGGIPFYLNQLDGELPLAKNIDQIFFAKNASLKNEFGLLFRSIFKNSEDTKKIVQFLYTRGSGFSKKEIVEGAGIADGGTLTNLLESLIASGIIISYTPFLGKKNVRFFKLVDPFCLFYLRFVDKQTALDETFWQNRLMSQKTVSWRGFAFENLCFYHVERIKGALGIEGIAAEASAYRNPSEESRGTQIDLVIDRNDNIVDLCEIKFYNGEVTIDKKYYEELRSRESLVGGRIPKRKKINNVLITTFGLTRNEYSNFFSKVITLDDLF